MKTTISLLRNVTALAVVLLMISPLAFADGETTEVYLTGTTISSAGDYVVLTTNDVFHFQGKEYEVFSVYYDDPEMNIRIAVNMKDRCKSFIAYNGQYIFFYECNKYGFGVRKVLFSNPWVKDEFNARQFHDQSVLTKQKRIAKKQAIGLIAAYLPIMGDH